ncbi:hypothetical protein [Rhodoferax sp. TS-BS-61-7]|jgi:hypothetical protein|uniref:hypothetical protein n=1 Tax=Rhodoferax sp. TS-BS-61-7 TaxID=2094194 RepID=UPI000CF73568|nr:hypothetical protein [Rhodoferax sp. TS-BS-61-7]PQA78372.1 hypothetical protein C5F53_08640 [Rhodoferax sp. TS-BS-61-7]
MQNIPLSDRPDYVTTYEQIVDKANRVKALLESRQIRLNPASVLGQLMKKAAALSSEWTAGEQNPSWRDWLFSALHVNRICSAVLGLSEDAGAQEALKRVASNDMSLPLHNQSQGKDAFFEIELADYLLRHGMKAVMAEPDILLKLDTGEYPVACKKINSIINLEGQLRKGGRQLRPFNGAGLIALNVDVLVPENNILVQNTAAEVNAELTGLINRFREENRIILQKPVAEQDCDGILFSITAMTHVEQMRPQVNYYTQIDVWTLGNANPDGQQRVFSFAQILSQAMKARRDAPHQ